jgi:hypothetical protein
LSATSGAPGDIIVAELDHVPPGTEARLLFDGEELTRGTATGTGESGSLSLSFAVPSHATPGHGHTVVFVGRGFQCDATNGAGFAVLAQDTARGGGGSLARTGMMIALYLAIALILLLVGGALVQAARRRRQAARGERKLEDVFR